MANTPALEINHEKFNFRYLEGTVKKCNSWSESRTQGGGGSTTIIAGFGGGRTQKIHTKVTNILEFWLETTDGKEHYYKVDANNIKVHENQEVRVVELAHTQGRKAGEYELVMLYNLKQERVYSNLNPGDMVQREIPWKSGALSLYMFLGFIGWVTPVGGLLHVASLTFGIPYLVKKYRYYKNKLKSQQQYLFSLPGTNIAQAA